MSISRDIRTITDMKTRAAQLLDQVNEEKRAVIVTQNGRPRAVVMDLESYEEMTRAIGLLKLIAQGEADFRAGRWKSQKEVFERARRRLKSLTKNGHQKA